MGSFGMGLSFVRCHNRISLQVTTPDLVSRATRMTRSLYECGYWR